MTESFHKKAQTLRAVLLGRGHKDRDILSQIKKASEYSQSQLLNTPPPTQTNHRLIPFIIPYNPDLAPLSNILRQHWGYIENDPVLSQIWPQTTIHFISTPQNSQRAFCAHQIHLTHPQPTALHLQTNSWYMLTIANPSMLIQLTTITP